MELFCSRIQIDDFAKDGDKELFTKMFYVAIKNRKRFYSGSIKDRSASW